MTVVNPWDPEVLEKVLDRLPSDQSYGAGSYLTWSEVRNLLSYINYLQEERRR